MELDAVSTVMVGLVILAVVTIQNRRILMQIQELLVRVNAQTTVIDSAITLLANIHGELQAAINANDPAAIQAVADTLQANTTRLADAVLANTDTAPGSDITPAPEPAPVDNTPPPADTSGDSLAETDAPPTADTAPTDPVETSPAS
jgi:hypothetical protein